MTSINCQNQRPSRRMNSTSNLSKKEKDLTPKPSPHRSLSLSDKTAKEPASPAKSSKILELEQKLLQQKQKMQSLQQEQQKLLSNQQEIQLKETKLSKKSNLLNLKANSEESKSKYLKSKSEDLAKQCEELLKTLENVAKIDKSTFGKNKDLISQVDKDVKVNKELRLLLKVIKNKLNFAKAKKAIKKQLLEKQGQQIESMEKILDFMVNKVEIIEDVNVLASVNLNLNSVKNDLPVGLSVCDFKDYCKGKNLQTSKQIIEEKQNLEVFQALCRKRNESLLKDEIKQKNLMVLKNLMESEKSLLQKEEVLKEKVKINENLQEMLKFWIQEYSRVSLAEYSE